MDAGTWGAEWEQQVVPNGAEPAFDRPELFVSSRHGLRPLVFVLVGALWTVR